MAADKEKVVYEFSGEATKLMKSLRDIARDAGFTQESMQSFVTTAMKGMKDLGMTSEALEQNIRDFYAMTQQNGKKRMFGNPQEAAQFISALQGAVKQEKDFYAEVERTNKILNQRITLVNSIKANVASKANTQQSIPALVDYGKSLASTGSSILAIRKEFKALGVDATTSQLAIYRLSVALGKSVPEASKEAAIALSGMQDRLKQISMIKDTNAQTNAIKGMMSNLISVTGLTAEQIAQQLAKIPGMQSAAIKQATIELANSQKGLKFLIRQTMGDITKAINTAFGVSFAMIFFQAAQMVTNFFATSLKRAKDFETNVRELRLSEELMSGAGIEITNKQLDETVKKLQEMGLGIAKVEAIDIVGQTGLILRNVQGISATQIDMVAQIIAYVKAVDGSIDAQTVLNAILDRNDKSITKTGIVFNAELVAVKAVEYGLAKQGEILSEQVKTATIIKLAYEQSAANTAKLRANIKGTAKEQELLAREQQINLETSFGQTLLYLQTGLKELFVSIAPALQTIVDLIKVAITAVIVLFQIGGIAFKNMAIQAELLWKTMTDPKNWKQYTKERAQAGLDAINEFNSLAKDAVAKSFATSDTGVADWLRKTYGVEQLAIPETATGTPIGGGGTGGLVPDAEEVKKSWDNILEDIQDYRKKAFQDQEDFNKDTEREELDHLIDMQRMAEDYNHDRAMVQAETNNEIAQENADHANEELEAELKFQEEMRQLREKFLFDLEDALAARDARQVIRLTKQYQMDVTNKTNEYELEKQERDRAHEQELADIRAQVNNRLAELEYEYNTKRRRAEEDFLLDQARKKADYELDKLRAKQEMDDRVATWVAEQAEQYNLSEKAATDLYNMLQGYYGAEGVIPALYNQTYTELANSATSFFTQFNAMIAQNTASAAAAIAQFNAMAMSQGSVYQGHGTPASTLGTASGGVAPWNPLNALPRRYAQGGMEVANQPTSAIFGDAGKELALFIPWNKLSQLGEQGGAGGAGGGDLSITVTLSPDLEARVVNNAMNGVAEVITRVARA